MFKYKYFYVTSFFNNIFLKKNKEYWFYLRSLDINNYLVELHRNFKYKSDPKWWDSMYSPEILCYYKEADCSSYANLNYEYCKFHNINCKYIALWNDKSGHAIVLSDIGIFSNIQIHMNISLEEYIQNNNWKDHMILKEYKK